MKLHLGCGKRDFGNDWIHIDGGEHPHLHSGDITELPFEDASVDIIYASHVIEYWDREEVGSLLKEWKRVLKPGGTLRLAVPDFMKMALMYISGECFLKDILGPLYGKMPMSDETIYHKTVYDYNDLSILLVEQGFKNVRRWDWREVEHGNIDDHSQAYLPHMDKENGSLISLNVECEK